MAYNKCTHSKWKPRYGQRVFGGHICQDDAFAYGFTCSRHCYTASYCSFYHFSVYAYYYYFGQEEKISISFEFSLSFSHSQTRNVYMFNVSYVYFKLKCLLIHIKSDKWVLVQLCIDLCIQIPILPAICNTYIEI